MLEFPRFFQASTVIRSSFIDSFNHFLIFKANVLSCLKWNEDFFT